MRILTYNILDGGEGRADPIAEVIEAQRADVVCLVEADNQDVLERISRRLKMDYVQAWGEKHAVALLSRWAIVESSNIAGLRADQGDKKPRCLLKALVAGPGSKEWPIGVVHLKGGAMEADEKVREQELEVVLEAFAAERAAGTPHILAGDFNANSPSQQIDLTKCSQKTAQEATANGGTIPRRVVQKILDAGYRDAVGPGGVSFTTQRPGQRVDYVFTFGVEAGRILEARVEHDRLAKYASDHFPVVVGIG